MTDAPRKSTNGKPRIVIDNSQTEKEGSGPPITEDFVALELVRIYGNDFRYCHSVGWYHWNGEYWQRENTKMIFDIARELARNLCKDEPKSKRAVGKWSFVSGVEMFGRIDRAFSTEAKDWDRDSYLLGTPGGTVDLRTGRLWEASPGDLITKHAAVGPADRADCPMWLRFLDESTKGDAELIEFLQRWCGYCLTGDIKEHALVFVYGGGGNGKSVFLSTIQHIIGDYAAVAAMETFIDSGFDRHPTDVAMLRGARLVVASETEEGRPWAEARIKQMTGGDELSARFMRQDFFTYKPQFKLTIVGNHQPVLSNVDDAARRRFNIVPFTNKPPEPDPDLLEKLEGEWPAILRWMIEGCLAWQQDGLGQPEIVRSATAEYFDDQDVFGQWLTERCRVVPGGAMQETTKALYASWKSFAETAGESPGGRKGFAERLRRKGLKDKHGRTGTVFFGIRVVLDHPDYSPPS